MTELAILGCLIEESLSAAHCFLAGHREMNSNTLENYRQASLAVKGTWCHRRRGVGSAWWRVTRLSLTVHPPGRPSAEPEWDLVPERWFLERGLCVEKGGTACVYGPASCVAALAVTGLAGVHCWAVGR